MEVLPLPALIAAPVLPDAAAETAVATAPSKKHERELAEMLCAFCHEGEDSDDPDEDPLMPVETGRAKQHYAHENCIWWCPDVWQDKDLQWQNVGKSLSRCHRLKCAVCGEVRDQQIERRGPVLTLRISFRRFAAIPLSSVHPLPRVTLAKRSHRHRPVCRGRATHLWAASARPAGRTGTTRARWSRPRGSSSSRMSSASRAPSAKNLL